MELNYVEDKTFDNGDFTEKLLQKGDYECCRFVNCKLYQSNISSINFIDCEFETCDLSLVNLTATIFRDVKFSNCKMLGIHFENCNQFGLAVSFSNCNLAHSSFYQTKLKRTVFKNCNLAEVNFTESDMRNSLFENCDFSNAHFENTDLENADFRSSYNYSIDPESNRIKKARFSLSGLPGLLGKYDIQIDNYSQEHK